jgi:hypothetical protein
MLSRHVHYGLYTEEVRRHIIIFFNCHISLARVPAYLSGYQIAAGWAIARPIYSSRAYTNVLFDPSTDLIVAGSSSNAKFASYDEDGNQIWEPNGAECPQLLTSSSHVFRSAEYHRTCHGLLNLGVNITRPVDHIGWVRHTRFKLTNLHSQPDQFRICHK